MISVAVIGCGTVSAAHFAAIQSQQDAQLVGVCDPDPDTLAAVSTSEGVPGFTDHHTLLEAVRPDVVHICTPHDQHIGPAADCLDRGVDVLIEKPVAHSLEDAERLVAHAEGAPGMLGVCFQNRYNATSAAMRNLIDSGRLGQLSGGAGTVIWSRNADYYKTAPWRGTWRNSGGGLLINQAIHTLDLLQWLLGEVVDVQGIVSTSYLGDAIEVEDTAQIVMAHENGARSVFLGTNACVDNLPVTLDISASEAAMHVRGDLTVTWRDGSVETVAKLGAGPVAGKAYWGSSHGALIADFYAAHSAGENFWIDGREALKSLRIVKAVYAQTGTADSPDHPWVA